MNVHCYAFPLEFNHLVFLSDDHATYVAGELILGPLAHRQTGSHRHAMLGLFLIANRLCWLLHSSEFPAGDGYCAGVHSRYEQSFPRVVF